MISAWRWSLIAGCCLYAGAAPMAAQMASPTMSDATVVSRGALRLAAEMRWTRIDGVFGPDGSGVLSRGSSLTANVGTAVLPLLAPGEAVAQALAADPSITFSAGQLTTSLDSRVATVPLTAEYGLTSRITLGMVVPIVQARSVVTAQLNGRSDSSANVGTNPAAFHQSASAYAQNSIVATALTVARDQLAQRVAGCASNPAGPGCAALAPRTAEANALITASTGFASGIAALYGVDANSSRGATFVPLAGSPVQAAINARLAALRAGYTSFGIDGGTFGLAAAQAAAANAQLQRLLTDPEYGIGLDSLGSTEQTAIGDVELSATALLFNSFRSNRGVKLRGVVAGVLRLGTGHPARAHRPFDVATGDGQNDIEVRGAVDALTGRLLTTIAGSFTVQSGSVATARLPALILLDAPAPGSVKLGNMASVRVNPRVLLTPGLMVGAIGIGSHRAADEFTTAPSPSSVAQALTPRNAYTVYSGGVTIAYSNLASASGTGSRQFPAEVIFTHLETLAATAAGAEKTFRDSIELRLYLRTRR